jgi:hypothetical protein
MWQYEGATITRSRGPQAGAHSIRTAILRYGRAHLTWTAADIHAATGADKHIISVTITSLISDDKVKRIARGMYRLTGVV